MSFDAYMGVLFVFFYVTQDPGRVSSHDRVGWDIFGDNASGSNDRILTDTDIGEYGDARSDRCAPVNDGALYLPVSFRLQAAIGRRRSRIAVVDESHSMTDEDVILDHDPFTDEGVTGNLAALANRSVLLNLDKGADLGIVAYLTTVEVDELRQPHIRAQF